jgi:hypothetical protein
VMEDTHRGGLMHVIPCSLRRATANPVPIVIATGRAGGTDTVTKSKKRSRTFCHEACVCMRGGVCVAMEVVWCKWSTRRIAVANSREGDVRRRG